MSEHICPRCKKRYLFSETELETNICDTCADILIAKANERRDWDMWHSDDEG